MRLTRAARACRRHEPCPTLPNSQFRAHTTDGRAYRSFSHPCATFSFLHHELAEPCNFYLFVSQSGYGKTSLLELMAAMMGMLGQTDPQPLAYRPLDSEGGRAQWDIRMRVTHEGERKTVILSLLAGRLGEDVALRVWGEEELARLSASSWHRLGQRLNEVGRTQSIGRSDALVQDLHAAVQAGYRSSVGAFEAPTLTLPTLLYFSAYRDILSIPIHERAIIEPDDWGYAPVHRFDKEGGRWRASLDNLLVWMKWLDDGRFERARDLINERVFAGTDKYLKDVRRQPPEAIVATGDGAEGEHTLDRLSSSEKSLIQLFLRIGAHMTQNTVLAIDELDVHLHPKWQHRLLMQLKRLIRDNPGMTIIATTHSADILKAFAFEIMEPGLRKGGYIIEDQDR